MFILNKTLFVKILVPKRHFLKRITYKSNDL